MEGRGEEQVDLRIYKLDPLDRNFWPFPNRSVRVYEESRPPGPGGRAGFCQKYVRTHPVAWKSAYIPIGAAADERSDG